MATSIVTPPRPRAWGTIAGGGLLAGFLDGADAIIYYHLLFGIPVQSIFHYIASGLIGVQASVHAGLAGVSWGVILRFSIAIAAAAAYSLAALKLPTLIRRPILSGTIL